MLLAAIARPEKIAALVGISTAADHIVSSFNSLPLEVGKLKNKNTVIRILAFGFKYVSSMDLFMFVCTDTQGVSGERGMDTTLQARRRGSLQV